MHPPAIGDKRKPYLLNDMALAYLHTGHLKIAHFLLESGFAIASSLAENATAYSDLWTAETKAAALCLESLGAVKMSLGDLSGSERDLEQSLSIYFSLGSAAQELEIEAKRRMILGAFGEAEKLWEASEACKNASLEYVEAFKTLLEVFLYAGASNEIDHLLEGLPKSLRGA